MASFNDSDSLSLHSYDSDTACLDTSNNSIEESSTASFRTKESETECNPDEDQIIMSIASRLGFSGMSAEDLDNLITDYEEMERAHRKYIRAQLLMDAVKEVVSDESALPSGTKQRAQQALDHLALKDHLTLSKSSGSTSVYGITTDMLNEALPISLSPIDKKSLKRAVEKALIKKSGEVKDMNKLFTDTVSKVSGLSISGPMDLFEPKQTVALLDLKKELDHEVASQQALLIQINSVLGKLVDIKTKFLELTAPKSCSNLENESLMQLQHVRLLNMQVVKEMYTEEPHLIAAFTELRKELDCAVDEAKSKLFDLKAKEAKYMALKGTQYDDLLSEYKNLKKAIAEKKFALDKLL